MKTIESEVQYKRHKNADKIPDAQIALPGEKHPTQIPTVINPVLNYTTYKGVGRGRFVSPEYDLAEIGRVEDTESFVRQSFDKKVALMFKEGFDFIGKNPKTIRYIRLRLAQIARASQIPTLELMRTIGSSLIRKSNAIVLKVRKTEASGGKIRTNFGGSKELKPVAAYFPVPSETIEISAENNKIHKWRQRMPDGSYITLNPDNIIHMHFDRKDGFIFGTPTIVPVIDDIRALRKIEENIELLIYQHLFPLFQFQVGTENAPAGITETGEREVDVIRHEIQYMPSEGGIVTTERHKITAIGTEGRALRAETYLGHFKKRVVAGLGVSLVDLGDGDTTNRSTSDNMSRNLIDSVKDFQQVFECFFNELIINELLLESTFGDTVLDEENRVFLKFKEIDIDTQIKKEAHYADQFNKDLITHDEARTKTGSDPIKIPSQEEQEFDQDWESKYPEWHKMRWKMFEEPKLLIQALDEPYSLVAKAAKANSSIGVTGEQVQEATSDQQAVIKQKQDADAKKALAKSKLKAKDAFLSERFNDMQTGIITYVNGRQRFDHKWIGHMIRTSMMETKKYMMSVQMASFKAGYSGKGIVKTEYFVQASRLARGQLQARSERYIDKLVNDLILALERNVGDGLTPDEISTKTRIVFETLKYRTQFIEDVEPNKAHIYGEMLALRDQGHDFVVVQPHPNCCDQCGISATRKWNTASTSLDEVPPFHAGCHCLLIPKPPTTIATFDSAAGEEVGESYMESLSESGQMVKCPKCGKTAIRTKDTPDTYVCRACNHSFKKENNK